MPTRASSRTVTAPTDVTIEYRKLNRLKPYDKNPRINEPAISAVMNSIQDFGFLVPIVVDNKGVIVAGHTRYEAAGRLGMTEVPCIEANHLSPDQIKTFRVIDNKTAELADWDMDLLAGEISSLVESGINLTGFGWTQEDIDCLTDLVADDCMSAGTEAGLGVAREGSTSRADPRAPTRTRFVLGEVVFFIDRDVYRRWIQSVRVEHDGVEADIIAAVKDSLGITPFETAGQNRRRGRTH
jgi:hypothetical protein